MEYNANSSTLPDASSQKPQKWPAVAKQILLSQPRRRQGQAAFATNSQRTLETSPGTSELHARREANRDFGVFGSFPASRARASFNLEHQ